MSLLANIVNASPKPVTAAAIEATQEFEAACCPEISIVSSNLMPGKRLARFDDLTGYGDNDLEALGDLLRQGAFGKIKVHST